MKINVTDNSGEVLKELKKQIKSGLTAIGMKAETYTKKETPVDTGRLRNSMTYEVGDSYVAIGTNVEYAPFIEFGTSKRQPRHMLSNAVQNHMSEYQEIMETALKA